MSLEKKHPALKGRRGQFMYQQIALSKQTYEYKKKPGHLSQIRHLANAYWARTPSRISIVFITNVGLKPYYTTRNRMWCTQSERCFLSLTLPSLAPTSLEYICICNIYVEMQRAIKSLCRFPLSIGAAEFRYDSTV